MTNDTDEKFQELAAQTEAVLLARIEKQAAMIAAALGYIHADQPEIATIVLEGAPAQYPDESSDAVTGAGDK